jgi:hypothetical protein
MEDKKKQVTIRDLYPDLSDDELAEVEEALRKYAELVWSIIERLEREAKDAQPGKNIELGEPQENHNKET